MKNLKCVNNKQKSSHQDNSSISKSIEYLKQEIELLKKVVKINENKLKFLKSRMS